MGSLSSTTILDCNSELDNADYGPCAPGSYCPAYGDDRPSDATSASNPIACLAGTYSDQTLASDASSCEPCLEGMLCESDGLTEPSGDCPVGYYCDSGKATIADDMKCDRKTFCPVGELHGNDRKSGATWPMTC